MKFNRETSKVEQIIEGYVNKVRSDIGLTSDDEEKLFSERMKICNACQYRGKTRCKKCGCLLSAKTKSKTSKCPINKW